MTQTIDIVRPEPPKGEKRIDTMEPFAEALTGALTAAIPLSDMPDGAGLQIRMLPHGAINVVAQFPGDDDRTLGIVHLRKVHHGYSSRADGARLRVERSDRRYGGGGQRHRDYRWPKDGSLSPKAVDLITNAVKLTFDRVTEQLASEAARSDALGPFASWKPVMGERLSIEDVNDATRRWVNMSPEATVAAREQNPSLGSAWVDPFIPRKDREYLAYLFRGPADTTVSTSTLLVASLMAGAEIQVEEMTVHEVIPAEGSPFNLYGRLHERRQPRLILSKEHEERALSVTERLDQLPKLAAQLLVRRQMMTRLKSLKDDIYDTCAMKGVAEGEAK